MDELFTVFDIGTRIATSKKAETKIGVTEENELLVRFKTGYTINEERHISETQIDVRSVSFYLRQKFISGNLVLTDLTSETNQLMPLP